MNRAIFALVFVAVMLSGVAHAAKSLRQLQAVERANSITLVLSDVVGGR